MRQEQGVALVISLLVLVAVAAIGAVTLSLTHTNLKVADNTRSTTLSKGFAEAGLNATLKALWDDYVANGNQVPDTFANANVPTIAGQSYELLEYREISDDFANCNQEAFAKVKGEGDGGVFVVEAYIDFCQERPPGPYTQGFVSNGAITLPGNTTFDLNVHAGEEVVAPGTSSMGDGRIAWSGTDECRMGTEGNGNSDNGNGNGNGNGNDDDEPDTCVVNQDPPQLDDYDFAATRQGVADDHACTQTVSGATAWGTTIGSGEDQPIVVCLLPGTTLTFSDTATVENLVIIGDETTNVDFGASSLGNLTVASGVINLSDSGSLYGANTFYAQADVEIAKNIFGVDDRSLSFVATEGNILLNGGGDTDIYASFRAEGHVEINGTLDTFIGSIVADEYIDIDGAITHASLPSGGLGPGVITNKYPGIYVNSRR